MNDHLGNVSVTLSDYRSSVRSASNYYPFGMMARSYNANEYRFGNNTQEKVEEIASGHCTAEYWEYDSRLGRRWNIDPKLKYNQSGYSTFANNPLVFADPYGDDTIRVISSKLNENGEKFKEGDKPLYLFTVYTNDKIKGDMKADKFQRTYQLLAKNVTETQDGVVSKLRPYAKFISVNSNRAVLKKSIYTTTVGEINKLASDALDDVGGANGGLNSYEKVDLFNHGEKYDFKFTTANELPYTYVEGVGVFESDHIGNIIYGSVAQRAGQHLTQSLYDGDWLSRGYNADDPFDSYALSVGHIYGRNGITVQSLTSSNLVLNKIVTRTTTTMNTSMSAQSIQNVTSKYKIGTFSTSTSVRK